MANNKPRDEKPRKSSAKKKVVPKAKAAAARKQSAGGKVAGKKVRRAAKKKRSRASPPQEIHSPEPSTLGGETFSLGGRRAGGGTRSRSAGQAGDVQALPREAIADSESVEELLDEGQAREAAAISGVENAADADESEVRTHEVPEDDVPEEYIDED